MCVGTPRTLHAHARPTHVPSVGVCLLHVLPARHALLRIPAFAFVTPIFMAPTAPEPSPAALLAGPKDFGLSRSIDLALERRIPIFGVCLGLQGIVEHFGGELSVLGYPQHGKPAEVQLHEPRGPIFDGLPETFQVARYHSLHSNPARQPKEIRTTASTLDGCVMAIQHTSLPIAAVQFHPESILTPHSLGLKMLSNALTQLRYE